MDSGSLWRALRACSEMRGTRSAGRRQGHGRGAGPSLAAAALGPGAPGLGEGRVEGQLETRVLGHGASASPGAVCLTDAEGGQLLVSRQRRRHTGRLGAVTPPALVTCTK